MPVRVPLGGLSEGERTLGADASRYLCRVLRRGAGDTFVAFDPDAHVEADGEIVLASASAARVRLGPVRAASVVASAPLVLVYALAKGDKVDAVVRDATELGASRVVVARTERAVAKLDGPREEARLDRWRRVAEQAARQCGRSDPPQIAGVLPWREALERAADCDARFCLDPKAETPLGAALAVAASERAGTAFAVGPEGGLTDAEVTAAASAGFTPVSLGRFVLRTETVAAAVLGATRVLFDAL